MSITEDDIRLEQLRRLRAQAVPPPQPDVIPPSQAMVPPDLSYRQRADALEQQAAPPPDPYAGMGTGKQMLMRGLAGAAGGAIHAQEPGGYTGYLDHQQQVERQREQDLLGRAKELRGEGYQRERDFTQDQQVQQVRELRQQEMGVTEQHYQDSLSHQREQERLAQEKEANQIQFGPQGSQPFKQGQPFGSPVPRSLTATEKGLQHVPGKLNGQDAWAVFNPNPDPGEGRFTDPATGQDISAAFKPAPPSSAAGVIYAAQDPEHPGNTVPVRITPQNQTIPINPPRNTNLSLSKPTTQTAQTTEKLQTNARDSQNKYQTLAQLLALKTSAGDVDAVAKYFDIVMPAVGRRFSDTEIAQIQSVGDIQARARILLQKFGGRQMFDDSARQEILQSAKINADSAQREWDDYQRGRSGGGGSTTPEIGAGTTVKVQKWGKDPKTGLPVRLP